jgi:Cu/Ag efflux pump CusA
MRPYFLRVVAGCCQNGTLIEKTMKKIFISYLPTLIFSRYETGTTGIFLRLMQPKAMFLFNHVISQLGIIIKPTCCYWLVGQENGTAAKRRVMKWRVTVYPTVMISESYNVRNTPTFSNDHTQFLNSPDISLN